MTNAQLNTAIKQVAKSTEQTVWDILAKLNQKDVWIWFLIRQTV